MVNRNFFIERPRRSPLLYHSLPGKAKEAAHEKRQEAHAEAEDQARASGPLPGELARHQAEAERRARHPPQAHRQDQGRPGFGRLTPTTGRSSSR